MRGLYSLILGILLSTPAFAVDCSFSGVKVSNSDGSVKLFSSFVEALKFAQAKAILSVGADMAKQLMIIDNKKELNISSDCEASIAQIVVRRSQAITVSQLKIRVESGNAIQIAGGDFASSDINLSKLYLEPQYYQASASGINIGDMNSGIHISDSVVFAFPNSGVVLGNTLRDISLDNSQIYDNFRHGLIIKDDVEVEINNSKIYGNGRDNLHTKASGFGIAISRSDLSKITISNTQVVYNFGCIERAAYCDINNYKYIGQASGNTSSYGIEGPGFVSSIKQNQGELAPDLQAYINTLDPKFKLLVNSFIRHAIFSSQTKVPLAKGYSSIRESQLKKCMTLRNNGELPKQVLYPAIDIATGKDMAKLLPFLDRTKGYTMQIPDEPITDSFCKRLERLL